MRIAVVDDSREDAQLLMEYLARYEAEHNLSIQTTLFFFCF